jgi:hypothetical protein
MGPQMSNIKLLEWFDDLEREMPRLEGGPDWGYLNKKGARYWAVEAEAAFEVILHRDHVCRREWMDAESGIKWDSINEVYDHQIEPLIGVFRTVHKMLKKGRLGSIVRADFQDKLLGQANDLIAANQLVAATVTAGGL